MKDSEEDLMKTHVIKVTSWELPYCRLPFFPLYVLLSSWHLCKLSKSGFLKVDSRDSVG